MRELIGLVCLALLVQGCVTAAPALRGKFDKHYTATISEGDRIDPDTGDIIRGRRVSIVDDVKAPAGVEGNLASATSVEPGGALNINQSGGGTSQGQIEGLTQLGIAQQQTLVAGINAGKSILAQAIKAAAPIYMKSLDNALELGKIDAATHAELSGGFLDLIKQIAASAQTQ